MLLENHKLSCSAIWIPGNVPSSKNSHIKTDHGIFPNKLTTKYIKSTKSIFSKRLPSFLKMKRGLSKPLIVGLHLVRSSNRRFDFNNISQILADLMIKKRWLFDDCLEEVFFIPIRNDSGNFFSVDSQEPGVYVKIISQLKYKTKNVESI